MDANGTRYHLLLGQADWSRCRTAGGAPAFVDPTRVYWNEPRNEVTLWPETFRFPPQRGAIPLAIDDRRGAARDRFGNWYWIASDESSIQVFSSGSRVISTFWPPETAPERPRDDGGFRARDVATLRPCTLRGLAVTEDHYLVAGAIDTEGPGRGGIVVIDLYSGGPARRRDWPVAFVPFDLTPRVGGGVWILDRKNRRVWEVDRHFEIVSRVPAVGAVDTSGFSSADGHEPTGVVRRDSVRVQEGWLVPGTGDVVGVAALPRDDDGVLVLMQDETTGTSSIQWLADGAGRGPAVSTTIPVPDGPPIALDGYDFALGAREDDDPDPWVGRLYVVVKNGNQSYAYGVELRATSLVLHPLAEYYPMRNFGGRALVVDTDRSPWYDSGKQWVPLVLQNRPRYAETGEIWTHVLDGREPGCVWHRLLLDACIPPGTSIDVYTRAADDWRAITLAEWLSDDDRVVLAASADGDTIDEADLVPWRPEPNPYLRGDGSELPFIASPSGSDRGTWELLFQSARGRYLQIKLVLNGDGRSTPRLRALRAWYPRFSYLTHYLPAVYSDQPQSASFVDRFLANVEGIFTAIEDRIAAAQLLFDITTAPSEALDWLGKWFGVAMDPLWEDARRRLFLRHAMEFFQARGTIRGLQMALRLALDECVDDRVFEAPTAPQATPIRIIERFRARRTPPALLGDVRVAVPGPQRVGVALRWTPQLGGADLNRRYREASKLDASVKFPIVAAGAPDGWSDFAQQTLGFVPQVGGAERAQWQKWLRVYFQSSVTALRANQGSSVTFDSMQLPLDEPTSAAADTWTAFLTKSPNRERSLWQDFLARRYRTVAALNAAWRTHWTAFARVSLPDVVPIDGAPLVDWFQFEGIVIAMQATAHRFTVMLPVRPNERIDTPTQQRRLALAKTVLDLEKPAHTVYDMRFYWAMFRLGEARLGDDTLIGLGSRAPELMGPMILGSGYLAESFLAPHTGADAPSRLQIGRDRVGRSAQLGGP